MKEKSDFLQLCKHKSGGQMVMDGLLKFGAFFIILEPIWMLLPFAGFLYGSVMHIQLLSRNPYTSWLVHFVLPTHTLFPVGIILIVLGLSIFLVGAFQIYSAKLLKKGLVTTGIYRWFRHPQYLALTLFGIGILLTWGRFITFIAFFVMMWLYYFLSMHEESKCRKLFGEAYDAYRSNTWFLFPGEHLLVSSTHNAFRFGMPTWLSVLASFAVVVGIAVGSGLLIQRIKHRMRTFPAIQGPLLLSDDGLPSVNLVMVKGPVMQAAPFKVVRNAFMDKAYRMLTSSEKIKQALRRLDLKENQTVLVFLTPGSNWHNGTHHDHKSVKINAFMLLTDNFKNSGNGNIMIKYQNVNVLKAIKAHGLSYDRLEKSLDPAEGKITVSGPPMGVINQDFEKRMQRRMEFFISGL